MYLILLIIAFALLALIFFKKSFLCRNSILNAFVIWGLLLTLSTEILGLYKSISFNFVALFWFIVDLVLLAIFFRLPKINFKPEKERLTFFSKILIIRAYPTINLESTITQQAIWTRAS